MCKPNKVFLLAALFLASCGEVVAPLDEDSADLARGGRWLESTLSSLTTESSTTTATDSKTSDGSVTDGSLLPANTLVQAPTAPALMTYNTSFTVRQGQLTHWTLYYRDPATGEQGDPFLWVVVPRDAQLLRPDGTPARNGEKIDITVSVDPVSFFVEFGPHGSRFDGWMGVQLWFNQAHADLQAATSDAPTVWYQSDSGQEWEDQSIRVTRIGSYLWIEIVHFSNYAVAW